MWLAIAWTMREFARVKRLAAFLLIPYLLWTTFTVAMNLAIWKLNP
jgi:translocator protein